MPASNPTVVNNVETLATVTQVLARGPEWHRSLGTAESPAWSCHGRGRRVRPGVGEVEMGRRWARSSTGSAAASGRAARSRPSSPGVANPVITGDQLDVPVQL